MSMFQKAEKSKAKLRMAIDGPTGSGKTFTALSIATHLGKKVAVLDTEGGETGSANKYADLFTFDHAPLTNFHPQKFIDAIHTAEREGYDVLVIDSMSHAWMGEGGILDQADRIAKKSPSRSSFSAWKEATPLHRSLIDAILHSKLHIICTMRSKMDYVLVTEERGGRTYQVPKKIGMAPVQRDDVPYEFDIVGDMDEGTMVISKTRCHSLTGEVIKHPGAGLAKTILDWLNSGVEPVAPPPKAEAEPPVISGLPEEPKFWDESAAIRLRNALSVVEHTLRQKDPEARFDMANTRDWIGKRWGYESHKQLLAGQFEELLGWLRRINKAGEIVE